MDGRRRQIGRTPAIRRAKKRAYLKALEATGAISVAADAACINRKTPEDWRAKSPKFEAAEQRALANFADRLEKEAVRRATKGLKRKKFTKSGEPIMDPATGGQYVEREFSDTLLIFMLKGARPDKYKERLDVRVSKEEQEIDERFTKLVAAVTAGSKEGVGGEEGAGGLRIEVSDPTAPTPTGLPGPDL